MKVEYSQITPENNRVKGRREFIKKLVKVQAALKATKDKKNDFGGYAYRTAEGILAAVKPLLAGQELYIKISDNIRVVGEQNTEETRSVTKTVKKDTTSEKITENKTQDARVYVVSTVTITDGEFEESCSAYARETLDKKGMDQAMVTGAASSYARKYALNGMFGIDDSKNDPDRGQSKMIQEMEKRMKLLDTQEKADAFMKKVVESKMDGFIKDFAKKTYKQMFKTEYKG